MHQSALLRRFGGLYSHWLFCLGCLLAFSAEALAVDDGTWIKMGEAYLPTVSGDVAAPTVFGDVPLTAPLYAVGPDGVGVIVATTTCGTSRFVFAMRCDELRLCGWYVLPSPNNKWVLTHFSDDSFGVIIPVIMGRLCKMPPGYGGYSNLYGIVNLGLFDPAKSKEVAQFIRDSGIPSVALAKSGQSMWFAQAVSASLRGIVSPNPLFTSVNLPSSIRNTVGFVNDDDWLDTGSLNRSRIANGDSPFDSTVVTSLDATSAALAYSLSYQRSGARGDEVVYTSGSFGLCRFIVGLNMPLGASPAGDCYRYEIVNGDGSPLTVPGYENLGDGSIRGSLTSAGTYSLRAKYYYPNGSSTFNGSVGTATSAAWMTGRRRILGQFGSLAYYRAEIGATSFPLKFDEGSVGDGTALLIRPSTAAMDVPSILNPTSVNIKAGMGVGLHHAFGEFRWSAPGGGFIGHSYPLWLSIVPAGLSYDTRGEAVFAEPTGLAIPTVNNASGNTATAFTAQITCVGAQLFDVYPKPQGMVVNHSNGSITWQAPVQGNHVLKIWGHDGVESRSASWVLNIGEGAFAIVSPSSGSVVQGGQYELLSNRPNTTWSAGTLPSGITLTGNHLQIAASVPTGSYTIALTATAGGESTQQTLTLTVTQPGTPTGTVTSTVNNPDGSSTVTTTTTQPNGTTITTTSTIPAGGGTPVTSTTTTGTGTGGNGNQNVVDAINNLDDVFGIPQTHPAAGPESFGNQGNIAAINSVGEGGANVGWGLAVPNAAAAPLTITMYMPTPGTDGSLALATPIDISTAPPAIVQPYLFIVRYIFGFCCVVIFYHRVSALFKNA